MLSKEHSGDICVRVPRALGSCENCLKPGLLQPPAEPVYQGLWRLTLTRFSPGLRLSAGKARVPWRLDSSPVPSLSCVCRTVCWDTNPWRTPGQPQSSTASPGESRAVRVCCRQGDPFQGLKLGSCLTLGNELSEETHVLTKQEILLGKGTQVESRRVREPRRTALPHGAQSPVLW